jgi:hypothetical protein
MQSLLRTSPEPGSPRSAAFAILGVGERAEFLLAQAREPWVTNQKKNTSSLPQARGPRQSRFWIAGVRGQRAARAKRRIYLRRGLQSHRLDAASMPFAPVVSGAPWLCETCSWSSTGVPDKPAFGLVGQETMGVLTLTDSKGYPRQPLVLVDMRSKSAVSGKYKRL